METANFEALLGWTPGGPKRFPMSAINLGTERFPNLAGTGVTKVAVSPNAGL